MVFFLFQVSSMDQFLKVQEHLSAELKKQIKMLSNSDEENKKMYEKKLKEVQLIEQEIKELQSQIEEKERYHREAKAEILSLEEQKAALEKAVQEMKKDAEVILHIDQYYFCPV